MSMSMSMSTEDILGDNMTRDPNSITSLTLNRKAISCVPSLSDFNKLQRLDLSFNGLTSLKGLESCFNLKWLSVQQNNLHDLNGIQALTNLAVFNAGKNNLKSMGQVKGLVKLRALILNDNQISSISGLDHLFELNTLVLSRNPIRKVGTSLANQKSIIKVSLTNCQLENIDDSIKACTGLEQLRLAHNDIKTLPEGLANNKKLQILDLGNNMISRWSDLEVLSSLHNLKNLNLLGNPIAEKVKLIKKVKKLVPTLQILNSKRMDLLSSVEEQKVESAVISVGNVLKPSKKKDHVYNVKHWDTISNNNMDIDPVIDVRKEKDSGKAKTSQITEGDPGVAQIIRKIEQNKKEKHVEKEADQTVKDKRSKRKVAHIDVIDDKETPFAELVAFDAKESMNPNDEQRESSQGVGKFDTISPLVTYPAKKKKKRSKNQGAGASVLQFLTPEFGLGGPSSWTDEID